MYAFTQLPYPHGRWQLEELLGITSGFTGQHREVGIATTRHLGCLNQCGLLTLRYGVIGCQRGLQAFVLCVLILLHGGVAPDVDTNDRALLLLVTFLLCGAEAIQRQVQP